MCLFKAADTKGRGHREVLPACRQSRRHGAGRNAQMSRGRGLQSGLSRDHAGAYDSDMNQTQVPCFRSEVAE